MGFEVSRIGDSDPAISAFLSADETIAEATREGLSVCDYIDLHHARPGATADTVAAMLKIGGLSEPVARVCEIGPGTGRYAEKVIAALHPEVYEIYETAFDWLRHLRKLPNVAIRPADGHSLASTESGSCDLVHAQKVFVYIPFITTAGYLREMARVVRPGGIVAFDVITENCLTDETVDGWLKSDATLFIPTPRSWVIEFLAKLGLTLEGSVIEPLPNGSTELLVFRRAVDPA